MNLSSKKCRPEKYFILAISKSKPLRKKSHKVVDLIGRNFYLSGQSFTMIYRCLPRRYHVIPR